MDDAWSRPRAPRPASTPPWRFWDAVVDAADSIVFRLLFNSLRLAYEPAIAALAPVMEAEVDNVDGYRALAEAIVAAAETPRTGRRRPPPTRCCARRPDGDLDA